MSDAPHPDILIILTDQQSANMLSCAGNRYVSTPAMDRLAARGVRFDRAYCTNPVCAPSRFSLVTGRMPSEIGMRRNEDDATIEPVPAIMREQALGHLLRQAGYETVYGGKVHLPGLSPEDIGFDFITRDERGGLARTCADLLEQPHHRPLCLFASFINPHDICYMAIRDFPVSALEQDIIRHGQVELASVDEALQLPPGMSAEEFMAGMCPPLPDNFEPQLGEPEAVSLLLQQLPFRHEARRHYTDHQWRMHRWAYRRLTERVDHEIGQVLDALHASGRENNTLVIFTSDHGDIDSAHRMDHKIAFYEEACRVPLIMAGPGVARGGQVDCEHLVSNGLDLLPTLCDVAGVPVPLGLPGHSLWPLLQGHCVTGWRPAIPVESEIGSMVVTDRYKCARYDVGRDLEQLVDLQLDPGETRNLVTDAGYHQVLHEQRQLWEQHFGR